MRVAVAISNSGSIYHQRMVQKSAIAILRFIHAFHEIAETPETELIYPACLRDLLRIEHVMRWNMASFRHADFRDSAVGALFLHHEGNRAGHVSLIRDHH